ncbi:MAG: AAA family ATPase [Bacteriovoracaceae bacterium]|jgi:cellulose biosynthesis protein BcsQ|nr:AAA family ATPase [Bacteriovoracaceae bacterium]
MISTKVAGDILDITSHRVKQILNSNDDLNFERKEGSNGQIKIPSNTMSKLLKMRDKEINPKTCVIKSQKGGVGGTTITINVAIRAAQKGAKVLVWDLDPESNATTFLMQEDYDYSQAKTALEIYKNEDLSLKDCVIPTRFDGVYLIPAKGIMRRVDRIVMSDNPKNLLKEKLKDLEGMGFTTILFDLPPTFSRLSESAYITSDICLLPTDASAFGIEGAILTKEDIHESCKNFEQRLPEIKVFLSRAHNQKRTSVKNSWEYLIEEFGPDMLPIKVPERADVVNNINDGKSIFDGKCSADVRAAIDELVEIVAPIGELQDHEVLQ